MDINGIWERGLHTRIYYEDPSCPQVLKDEHITRYKFAVPYVKEKRVLDIACGSGYGSSLLAETAATVNGRDLSPEAIEYCKNRFQSQRNLIFSMSNAEQM